MCCNKQNTNQNTCETSRRHCDNNWLIIIVLYILLAIILGSCLL